MKILGISCFYHEGAAALLIDGAIVAASAEERFSRNKHDQSFPKGAIDFCLKEGKITAADLDYIVFYENPFCKFERNLIMSFSYFPKSYSLFVDSMKNFLVEKLWVKSIIATNLNVNSKKILFVPHHVSHASASYYSSPFQKSAFLTLDGVGEWTTASWGVANKNKLYPEEEIVFPHSVGLLYAAFTAFCGFEVNDGEYKLMGMAGYGKPIYIDKVKKLYTQNKDGSIHLCLDYFSFQYSSKEMYSSKFEELFGGLNLPDIASSVQTCTEEIIFAMLKYIYTKTKQKNLVLGGGVALNSTLNGKIIEKTPFENIFIYPASGDDGGAVGAALYLYHHVLNKSKRQSISHVFLGQDFSNDEIESTLKSKKIAYKKFSSNELISYIVKKLAEGKVVGWFEGRAEFGPRALGHRSILADPRNRRMKDIVNTKIKFREEFRPFAPAVLSGYADKYFSVTTPLLSRFMLATYKAKPIAKKAIPAVVHVDGTSRAQLIDENYSGMFFQLLNAFYKKTSVPVLLNTSFNVKGEPIVNSPQDAIKTFLNSGIDILVLENFLIEKK